jgi:hypothetical protein
MYLWKKAEVHNIQKDIAEFGSTFQNETHQNIESMWQSFKTETKLIIDKRVPTSLVKTDLNCSLRILALLWLSLFRNPCWFFSGATPINSWPLLLMYDHSLLVLRAV